MTTTARWWFPMIGEKLGPAWRAAAEILRDGEWHEVDQVLEVMGEACDALPKSLSKMLREGEHAGILQFSPVVRDTARTVRITLAAPLLLPELRDDTYPASIVTDVGIVDGEAGLWAQIAPLWDEAVRELRESKPEPPSAKVVPIRKAVSKPSRGAVEPEGVEHPDGEACERCGKVLIYKIVDRRADGKRFRLWSCPSQRARGDGHRSDFINDTPTRSRAGGR